MEKVRAADHHMLGRQLAQEAPGERASGVCYRMSDQLGGGRGQVLRIASERALRQETAQQDQGTARSRKEI